MKDSPIQRGAGGDMAMFAASFVRGRLAGFEKNMKISAVMDPSTFAPNPSLNWTTLGGAACPGLGVAG
jgi:hypothetical protein